jgi:hypothetical protein
MNKVLTRPPKPAPPKKTADKPDVKPTFATVPVDAQEFGSDGQPRAKLSWLLDALDVVIGMRGAYWKVEYSREEVIDAGGGEKLCSVKAVIAKVIADTANGYVGIGYGCSMLVERAGQSYLKHLDAWDVAQEKALAAAARFFGIGLAMDPLPEPDKNLPPASPDPEPNAGPDPDISKPADKEKALAELREAVKKFGMGSVILKIVQFKYGTEKVESLSPGLLRDLKENMIIYRQEWQKAVDKEAAAHGNSKRKDT